MSETTNLFRIENPNLPPRPDGVVSHPDLVGQWFAPDAEQIRPLIIKKAMKAPGARLVVAQVPTDALASYNVSEHPVAKDMDVEPDNYLIPRDGSVPTVEVPLDQLAGDLGGRRDFNALQEIKQRINHHLGELSLR